MDTQNIYDSRTGEKKWMEWCVEQCHTLPSKAEDEKTNTEESGNKVPDQGTDMGRAEVETKAEGSS